MADHAIFTCQLCKAKLHVTGHFEAGYDLKPGPSSRPGIALHTSALEGSKIDESFIVLADDKRAQAGA